MRDFIFAIASGHHFYHVLGALFTFLVFVTTVPSPFLRTVIIRVLPHFPTMMRSSNASNGPSATIMTCLPPSSELSLHRFDSRGCHFLEAETIFGFQL